MLFHLHERSSLLVFPAFQAVQGLKEEFCLLITQVTAVSLDSVYPEVMFLAYTNYNITQAASGERQGAAGGLAPSSRGASRGDVTWVLGQTVSIEPTLEHPARSTEGLVSNHPILAHQGNLRGLPKHLSLAFPRLLSTCSHQAQLFKVRVLQFSSSSSA